ncbi:MAG: gluconokinase [Pseudomonadota bacterium]|nr:gluconokinase [Pseudomonadota bacterium]
MSRILGTALRSPTVVIVMGVSGSGKTTIGTLLAKELNCSFLDADDFHPQANVAKMVAGSPLTDEDRWPWLNILADKIRAHIAQQQSLILACSALKKCYRQALCLDDKHVQFVYLKGDYNTICERLRSRESHFMDASLLDSQFAALEEPINAIVVDIRADPTTNSELLREALVKRSNDARLSV